MKAKCVENKLNNTNFTIGKTYELSNNGMRTNWGGIWTHFKNYNKPKNFNIGSMFDFGMCKFEIV
jgi:hypothetical protein